MPDHQIGDKANPLKRKSPPDALEETLATTTAGEGSVDGRHSDEEVDNSSQHAIKRSRRSRRPPLSTQEEERKASSHQRKKFSSPTQKRNSNSTPRPSRFLEGSMNDRTSKKPPSPFLGEERVMEQYTASQSMSNRESVDTTTMYDAGIESSRPSGMYRFGKAIANAFNPSAWRGINGIWKEKEKSAPDPSKAILQERGDKAQKAYAELKKGGFKGTQGASRLSKADDIPALRYDSGQESRPSSFRDSAVDLDEYRSSTDNKEGNEDQSMPAPNVPLVSRATSPMPNSSDRRSSLTLRTPSLQTLKKATSHLQLPSVKRHSAQSDASGSSQQIHKQPSKRDLAKQQKLSKRVSDLETQLEIARRKLENALEAAPPIEPVEKSTRKPFKPGALPSLPSERILNAHVDNDGGDEGDSQSGYMRTRSANRNIDPATQILHELRDATTETTPPSRKRKARHSMDSEVRHKTGSPDYEPQSTQSTKRGPQPRKSHKVEFPNLQPTRPLRRTTSGLANSSRQQSEEVGHKPSTRRSRQKKDVPPVPSLPLPVDPSSVDKVAIIAMRNVPNISAGFGQSAEDAINLRKAYPLLTDSQVEELLGKFRIKDNKITDYTSTTHHAQPASPALPPPSPVKKQPGFKPSISKSSLRSSSVKETPQVPSNSTKEKTKVPSSSIKETTKVPNNSPAVEIVGIYGTKGRGSNGKFVKLAALSPQSREEAGDVVAELSPSKTVGKELPPYPKSGDEEEKDTAEESEKVDKEVVGTENEKEKQLPGLQKDDFAWDEDVF